MKALLLKDVYMMKTYSRTFFLVVCVFLVMTLFGESAGVFRAYPVVVVGLLPITLISYEEREKWNRYTCALPVSKAALVGEKYLLDAGLICVMFVITTAASLFAGRDGDSLQQTLNIAWLQLAMALIVPALMLPLIYALGAEKGRIVFYIAVGLVCGVFVLIARMMEPGKSLEAINAFPGALALLASAVLFAASCGLSVLLYQRREI